jgi:N-acetylmuramoyl-L-alanine amidase
MWRMGKGLNRGTWRLFLLAAALCLGAAAPPSPQAAPPAEPAESARPGLMARVTAVRVGQHPGMTRIVFDVSDNVDYRIFFLADPYRVVIDLPELSWEAPPPRGDGVGLIKAYRYGMFAAGTWRVVLDTAGPVKVANMQLIEPREGYRYRLVLDLAPDARDSFLAAVKRTSALAVAAMPPAEPAPAPAPKARPRPEKKVVVIDPGHGGVDPGALGRTGVYEKFITLAMAQELKRQLDATGRYEVKLTRDRDIFLPLRQRIAIARADNADLFISLHADTIQDPTIRGLSVYTLSETASDSEAAALAASENKADVIAGVDLTNASPEVTNILIDLAQRETMNLSANFAEFAVDDLARETRLLGKTHRFAGFAVLKAPDVPSVLVELGYLSHREEERQLRDPGYRAKLSSALVKSVDHYFGWKDALSKS